MENQIEILKSKFESTIRLADDANKSSKAKDEERIMLLNESIKKNNESLKDIQSEKQNVERLLSGAQADLKTSQEKFDKLQTVSTEQRLSYNQEKGTLENNITNLQRQLVESEKDIQSKDRINNIYINKIEGIKKDHASKISSLNNSIVKGQEDLKKKVEELQKIKQDNIRIQRLSQERQQKQISDLVKKQRDELVKMKQDQEKTKQNIKRSDKARLQEQIKKDKKYDNTLKSERTKLNIEMSKVSSLNEKLNKLQNEYRSNEKLRVSLTSQIQTCSSNARIAEDKYRLELENLNKRASSLQKIADDKTSELTQTQKELTQSRFVHEQTEKLLTQVKSENEACSVGMNTCSQNLKEFETKIRTCSASLVSADSSLIEKDMIIENLKAELQSKSEQVNSLKREQSQCQANTTSITQSVMNQTKELQALKEDLERCRADGKECQVRSDEFKKLAKTVAVDNGRLSKEALECAHSSRALVQTQNGLEQQINMFKDQIKGLERAIVKGKERHKTHISALQQSRLQYEAEVEARRVKAESDYQTQLTEKDNHAVQMNANFAAQRERHHAEVERTRTLIHDEINKAKTALNGFISELDSVNQEFRQYRAQQYADRSANDRIQNQATEDYLKKKMDEFDQKSQALVELISSLQSMQVNIN